MVKDRDSHDQPSLLHDSAAEMPEVPDDQSSVDEAPTDEAAEAPTNEASRAPRTRPKQPSTTTGATKRHPKMVSESPPTRPQRSETTLLNGHAALALPAP